MLIIHSVLNSYSHYTFLYTFQSLQESTKRKAEEYAKAKVSAQKTKMRQIKTILNSDPSDADVVATPAHSRLRSHTTTAHITPARSEPDLSKDDGYSLRGAHQRAMTAYTNSINRSRAATAAKNVRSKSPPPIKPVSVLSLCKPFYILKWYLG